MGEMLRETERAKGVLKVGPQLPNVTTGQPTLTGNKVIRRGPARIRGGKKDAKA